MNEDTPTQSPGPLAPAASAESVKRKKRKLPWIVGGTAAAIVLVPTIAVAATAGSGAAFEEKPKPASSAPADSGADRVARPTTTTVPSNLVGMTAAEAAGALYIVQLTAAYDGDPGAKVVSVDVSGEVEVGSTVTLTVE